MKRNQCVYKLPVLFTSDQLSRLHMILKPFMLRRVKKDVENELSDKVLLRLTILSKVNMEAFSLYVSSKEPFELPYI